MRVVHLLWFFFCPLVLAITFSRGRERRHAAVVRRKDATIKVRQHNKKKNEISLRRHYFNNDITNIQRDRRPYLTCRQSALLKNRKLSQRPLRGREMRSGECFPRNNSIVRLLRSAMDNRHTWCLWWTDSRKSNDILVVVRKTPLYIIMNVCAS